MAKTNWTMGETVLPDDMNQIGQEINDLAADGSVTDDKIGNRTISDTTAPTGNTASPTTLWSWLAYMIKAVTGEASWRTVPSMTIKAIKTMFDNATAAATPDTLVKRDANGRFKAAAPVATDDVARLTEVDAKLSRYRIAYPGVTNDGTDVRTYAWQTGWYEVGPNTTNMPMVNNYWRVWATVSDANNLDLRAMAANGGVMYTTMKINGVWNPWRELFTTSGGTVGTLSVAKNGDATLTIEDTSAPTNTYRVKSILTSQNVTGGIDTFLFRKYRPSDGAIVDYALSGPGGNIITSAGGTFSGIIKLLNDVRIVANDTGGVARNVAILASDNVMYFGDATAATYIGGTSVKINGYDAVTTAGGQTINGTTMSGTLLLNNGIWLMGKKTDGVAELLITMAADNRVYVGSAATGMSFQSNAVPTWHNGTTSRNLIHDGGGQTINGKLSLNASTGEKFYAYDGGSGGSRLGIGVDVTGSTNELTLFHSTGSGGTEGRISFGSRRNDTGAYTERMALTADGHLYVTNGVHLPNNGGVWAKATGGDDKVILHYASNNTVRVGDASNQIFTYSGSEIWHRGNSAKVTVASSAPGSPNVGDVWIDTSV